MEANEKTTNTETEIEPREEEKGVASSTPKKRPHKKLKVALILLVVVLLIPLFIAAWFGFVPGLSNLLGARSPIDLGVQWSEADYQSYLEKTEATFADYTEAPTNPNDPSKKIIFADPRAVNNQSFTQEEISAAINSVDWAWMPISSAQVRFTDDTVEISGNMQLDNIEKFINFIGGVGYSSDEVAEAAEWGRRLVNGAPIYLKANASVSNDVLDFSLQEIKIGRYTVPQDIASTVVYNGSTNSINNAMNFDADNVSFGDGQLQFSGTYPTTVYVLRDE